MSQLWSSVEEVGVCDWNRMLLLVNMFVLVTESVWGCCSYLGQRAYQEVRWLSRSSTAPQLYKVGLQLIVLEKRASSLRVCENYWVITWKAEAFTFQSPMHVVFPWRDDQLPQQPVCWRPVVYSWKFTRHTGCYTKNKKSDSHLFGPSPDTCSLHWVLNLPGFGLKSHQMCLI